MVLIYPGWLRQVLALG